MRELRVKLEDWSGLLTCPNCGSPLSLEARRAACGLGHSYDLARQGYLNLLGQAQPQNADTLAMVAARERFLGLGHYTPIATAVAWATAGATRIVEAGAGTGYYLARCLTAEQFGLATDVSVAATKRAAQAHPRMAALVADTWAGLPLIDGSVGAVLSVFAPRNLPDFHRILRPAGRFVLVTPNPDHLAELRDRDGLLTIPAAKSEIHRPGFALDSRQILNYPVALSDAAVADLISMGPNAFHGRVGGGAIKTTVSVTISVFTAKA